MLGSRRVGGLCRKVRALPPLLAAVAIDVIILMAMQVPLVTIAAETFLIDEAELARVTGGVSVGRLAFAVGFL